ncbi:alkali-sensitive linkage protein 1-like [Haliotis rubra]|uniref:alkali-sensitive linkage protein 1-like n=1 Tax=Haliotis rubra TaxID=36100 RepID=UPI001EE5D56B|nr:alkali-sensitive linkage protein 1-like [Haliotis rubra]
MTWLALSVCVGSVLLVTAITKKGVTLTFSDHYQCNDTFVLSNVSWWYDWGTNDNKHHELGCQGEPRGEFVPMVWGYWGQKMNFPSSTHNVLGFNEPNHKDQSHMTPQAAATHWRELQTAAHGMSLVSPAPARCGSVGGLCTEETYKWLDDFFKACSGCQVDYVGVHSYTCNADNDMRFLETVYHRYHKKVWLTEFACPYSSSLAHIENYMKAIIPRLEAAPFVARYAWFQARITQGNNFIHKENALLEASSSKLTALGRLYNSLH